MARGRMIDKRVSLSKKLGLISDKARVQWFMLYPHLDREGRIAFDDFEDLQTEILPKFRNWNVKKIAVALNELADIRLITLYPHQKKVAIQFERFNDFQIGLRKEREAESKIPPPGITPENSGNCRITPALRLSISIRKEDQLKKEEDKIIARTCEDKSEPPHRRIKINFEIAKWEGILDEDKKIWAEAFPACDIEQELKKMIAWAISNPKKAKKSNYAKFIVNWLKKEQDSGGTKPWQKKKNESHEEFNEKNLRALYGNREYEERKQAGTLPK